MIILADKTFPPFFDLTVKQFERFENETAELIEERLPRVAEMKSYDIVIRPYFPYPGLDSNERNSYSTKLNLTCCYRARLYI